MSLSSLPLSYCTNVHPGQSVDEVCRGLTTYTAQVGRRLDSSIAAGLWLSNAVIEELLEAEREVDRLASVLSENGLVCYTLNAFPFGNFHGERVKEQVYLPDWTSPARLAYTQGCAQVLAALLPPGTEGSISTVPLGFKTLAKSEGFSERCIDQLLQLACWLDDWHDESGVVIRLAIEPEPLCVLETTAETIAFFDRLFAAAEVRGLLDVARRHLGVCYDVCHQAVEFEDVAASILALREADIRINKVHITCAIHIDAPGPRPEARQQLARFVEPRYLHQTFARSEEGRLVSQLDLDAGLCESPGAEFAHATAWRVHFHVPVNAASIGELSTTRPQLQQALAAVSKLDYAPHLEVETYTWDVLPGTGRPTLVDGLAAELIATRQLLQTLDEPRRS